jgi:hypothetical protein
MKFYVQAGSSAAERSEHFSFQFVKIYLAGLLYLLLSVEIITLSVARQLVRCHGNEVRL